MALNDDIVKEETKDGYLKEKSKYLVLWIQRKMGCLKNNLEKKWWLVW